ncbi:hypothetical protein PCANC_28770 [Puccinia coronata f. sp. avenae]|uniref:Uncharacterized protein n=1 Tax=Puccinia coronata f. sp. avenae TaxID=200324 RepID=A0A2N5TDX1_9BASI|nr:hypothetical protein PCANC_28770 [Puccinia coronata f. sp. avenae]
MVTSARRLVAPPPPAVRGISLVPQLGLAIPHRNPINKSMAALRDLASVADATSYLADDIPVPYYPDQEPETDWMAMKLEAVEDFLREQEVYSPSIRRTQDRPMATPAVAGLSTDRAPFVNLAARTETLHVAPMMSRAPRSGLASSRLRLARKLRRPTTWPSRRRRLIGCSTTPGRSDTGSSILPIISAESADDILRELSAFLSFYAPASEQEAAARIYLYRAFQSHFNRRL